MDTRATSPGGCAPVGRVRDAGRLVRAAGLAVLWVAACVTIGPAHGAVVVDGQVKLKIEFYSPNGWWDVCRVAYELMEEDPAVKIMPYSPLRIGAGLGYESAKIMAFAGKTAPDVMNIWFHNIQTYINQDLVHPLNEFVGEDGYYGIGPKTNAPHELTGKKKYQEDLFDPKTGNPIRNPSVPGRTWDRNGIIDDDEAKWDYYKTLPKLYRLICMRHDAHTGRSLVYAIPARVQAFGGLILRRDLLLEAGIDPNRQPRDWDEFFAFMQKLTIPEKFYEGAKKQRGQRGMAMHVMQYYWYPWVWSAGGNLVEQGKTNPRTGKTHWYTKEETAFIDPGTKESLRQQPSTWRATFANEAGIAATGFMWKLLYQKWLRDPQTGKGINLTDAQASAGQVERPDGTVLQFTPEQVIEGVARVDNAAVEGADRLQLFARGEVVCIPWSLGENPPNQKVTLQPENMVLWAYPPRPGPKGRRIANYDRHWLGMNATLAGDSTTKRLMRQKAWAFMSKLGGPSGRINFTKYMVEEGYAQFCSPESLKLAGLDEYIDEIPQAWRKIYKELEHNSRSAPYIPAWQPVADLQVRNQIIAFLMDNRDFDYASALKTAQQKANRSLVGRVPPEQMKRYRRWGWLALAGVVLGIVLLLRMFFRGLREKVEASRGLKEAVGSSRTVFSAWMPWLLLSPALLSIGMWAYYPLAKGTLMAFQDYRIASPPRWVGLDNFITIFLDPEYWTYWLRTIQFSVISIGLTFLAPIILAILLSEIPTGKLFFRTLYFLPRMCSPLVVILMWKQMYAPDEFGTLNQVLLWFGSWPGWLIGLIQVGLLALIVWIGWMLFRHAIGPVPDTWWGRVPSLLVSAGLLVLSVWLTIRWVPTLFSPLALEPQKWLGERWAMIAIIMPGTWMGAGVGSLIYLAALKSVDESAYEAADIDGAGLVAKVRYITIPTLKPLIIINFVGAVIGTFHAMQNIFAMTGGGPGNKTTVMALAIWLDAFAYLKFGTATAMAWTMGAMLIAFTVWQMRILKKVEFRRAAEN